MCFLLIFYTFYKRSFIRWYVFFDLLYVLSVASLLLTHLTRILILFTPLFSLEVEKVTDCWYTYVYIYFLVLLMVYDSGANIIASLQYTLKKRNYDRCTRHYINTTSTSAKLRLEWKLGLGLGLRSGEVDVDIVYLDGVWFTPVMSPLF